MFEMKMSSPELTARFFIDDYIKKSCPPSVANLERYKDAVSVLANMVIDLDKENRSLKINYEKVLSMLENEENLRNDSGEMVFFNTVALEVR